jgi:hypothetical protein
MKDMRHVFRFTAHETWKRHSGSRHYFFTKLQTLFTMKPLRIDGVAKTRQLLRCCDCLAASTYISTPYGSTIARLAFDAFCLAIPFDVFCESIKD